MNWRKGNTMDTKNVGKATIYVYAVEDTNRTSQNGKPFKAKILKTDKIGVCSITEFNDGFFDVHEGASYYCEYNTNGNYKNIRSIKAIDPSESEDDGCLPIDFKIDIPAEPVTETKTEPTSEPKTEPDLKQEIERIGTALNNLRDAFTKYLEAFSPVVDAVNQCSEAAKSFGGKLEAMK